MSKSVRLNWVLVKEIAFRYVPNWWPRAFLALSALYTYRFHGYMASPKELKEFARKNNISYRTILRGLKKLIDEGLVINEGSYYMLTPTGTKIASLMLNTIAEIENIIEASNREEYEARIKEVKSKVNYVIKIMSSIAQSEFLQHAITYLKIYPEIAAKLLKHILQNIEAEVQIQAFMRGEVGGQAK